MSLQPASAWIYSRLNSLFQKQQNTVRYKNVIMYVKAVCFIVLGEGLFCRGMMPSKASASKTVGVKGNRRDYLSDISEFCLKKKEASVSQILTRIIHQSSTTEYCTWIDPRVRHRHAGKINKPEHTLHKLHFQEKFQSDPAKQTYWYVGVSQESWLRWSAKTALYCIIWQFIKTNLLRSQVHCEADGMRLDKRSCVAGVRVVLRFKGPTARGLWALLFHKFYIATLFLSEIRDWQLVQGGKFSNWPEQ